MTFVAELLYPNIVTHLSKAPVEIRGKALIINELFLFLLSEKYFRILPSLEQVSCPDGCCELKDIDLQDTDYGFLFRRNKGDNGTHYANPHRV
jgi:hypothetical protein